MDILLIEPPPTNRYGNMRQFGSIGTYKADIAYPPIDLMKIAGYLREFKINSLIYDANTLKASIEDVAGVIEKESPRLVVFTTSTTAINKDMLVAKRAKEISQDIITATFGAHIKGCAVRTLEENEFLDIAIYADPEAVIRNLAQNDYRIPQAQGVYYRKGSDIIKNAAHIPADNLDEYGIAAHDMVEPGLYHDPLAKRKPLTITYGQIGCINNCTYCMSTLYGALRMRSVPHFIKELKFIRGLGFKEVFFIDCGFTNNLKWADELCDNIINESLDLTWWCLARADRLNQDILKKMKEAGCHSIGIGVESANLRIIDRIKKNVNLPEVIKVIGFAHKLKIRVLLYFQFGLPGETRETMRETLDYALKSRADLATFGIATPVPGTPFYDYIKENNLFITNDWSRFDPTLPPVYSYPGLSSEEIYEFSKKAYQAFYMRPSFIMDRMMNQRTLEDIKNNLGNFANLLSRIFI